MYVNQKKFHRAGANRFENTSRKVRRLSAASSEKRVVRLFLRDGGQRAVAGAE